MSKKSGTDNPLRLFNPTEYARIAVGPLSRKIGFSNFRRFIDFEPIEYDRITFLVGRNNSGKSTVVKALMLVVNFLKSGQIATFSFGEEMLENANIVTYERAKNRLARADFIRFVHGFGNYEVRLIVTGEPGMTSARVQELILIDHALKITFTLNPAQHRIKLDAQGATPELETTEPQAEEPRLEMLKKELRKWSKDKTSKVYIELNQEVEALKRKLSLLARSNQVDKPRGGGFSIASVYPEGLELQDALLAFLSESISMTFDRFKKLPENKGRKANELKAAFSGYVGLHELGKELRASVNGFFAKLNEVSLYYLGASSTKQPALYAIRDRNNALAQAIHEYRQLGIKPGEAAHVFLINWLKEENGFEVGDEFEIVTRAGEAYEVNVSSHGTKIPLSDKGMGSIQAMLLLFRLACIIHKTEKNPAYQPIVIIEEPELNLHPALQSRLTDLFLDVHTKYGIDFLVETHSEYMVRRTQVLVAEQGYATEVGDNPFAVIYFPKDLTHPPYALVHREDGTFDKSFGSGFLDEGSRHTLELIRMRREKGAK